MTIFESVKGTVYTAVDTIANATQDLVEKNRTNAKLNRLRLVMKNESELMNRAYITLGKSFYDSIKNGEEIPAEQKQKLVKVIDASKAKIAKARACYREIVDSRNDIYCGGVADGDYSSGDVVDITVACSNENEYSSSPFTEAAGEEEAPEEAPDKANEEAADATEEPKVEAADDEADDEIDSADAF